MRLLIILLSSVFLFAGIKEDFLNKNYSKVCNYANIKNNFNNSKMLSIIGVACVKSDKLSFLPYVIRKLVDTKEARKNAIYFLTIYTQKRLIYAYMFDGMSLNGFFLPKTDYILSKIFYALKKGDYKIVNGKYEMHFGDEKVLMYKFKNKVIVDEYVDDKLIKRRRYW